MAGRDHQVAFVFPILVINHNYGTSQGYVSDHPLGGIERGVTQRPTVRNRVPIGIGSALNDPHSPGDSFRAVMGLPCQGTW